MTSKHHLTFLCCLALAEASSNNFMVMSEVTVPMNEKGETIQAPASVGDANESGDEVSDSTPKDNDANTEGGGSDTDGEDDDEKSDASPSAPPVPSSVSNQPLRTLKRLQAMLDDSDYATSSAAIGGNHPLDSDLRIDATPPPQQQPHQSQQPQQELDKLWTHADRHKYRRTRRAARRLEEHQAYTRSLTRQQIVRAELERKELQDLRRKQMEVLEYQRAEAERREARQRQYSQEYSDDETDTDGMGFELPNLPVYLSDDGETEEFEEEERRTGDKGFRVGQPQQQPRGRGLGASSYSHAANRAAQGPPQPRKFQSGQKRPSYPFAQTGNSHYDYHGAHERPPPPVGQVPVQRPPPPFDFRQAQQLQQQQIGDYHSTNYPKQEVNRQYQYNPNEQTMNEHQQYNPNQQDMAQQHRQYELQYTAWAQAAANGYYYPPPTPPVSYSQQQEQTLSRQSQTQQYTPLYRPPHPNSSQEGYVQPPPYGASYPSFLPQQRAILKEAGQNLQHPGTQGFFTRDNQMTQEWLQRQQPSSLNVPNDKTANQFMPENSDTVRNGVDLQNLHNNAMIDATVRSDVPPLITSDPMKIMDPINAEGPYCELKDESAVVIAGAESKISFDSIQKLAFSAMGVSLLSYCAVSPRSLPFPEYNRLFLQNLLTVGLGGILPLLVMICIYDGKYNNINTVIGTFHVSFTLGYILAFVSEIILTTLLRLGVFLLWEPAIFSLTPDVPTIILPWVLREKQYRPKRITLFACDFGASCVASPIIEEYLKLKIVQWTAFLPRNFKPSKKIVQKGKRRKKKNLLQPILRDGYEVTNINCYVSQMMAASLGLKMFDTTRRILMYTKKSDDYKNFYALCRGAFPIHELCGTMTALLLARRNVLGVNTPLWKILGPAVFIHGMANFRGMKPIFKWGSSTPWSEMQLYPWKVGTNFTLKQLLSTSYAKIVWASKGPLHNFAMSSFYLTRVFYFQCTILLRVFGFCVKNYYLIGRQAMKRVTTYSGKLYAFSAKLETDAMLKRAKEK